MEKDCISQIIDYFKELKGLWENRHRIAIEEKFHQNNKNFSAINIILTLLLLVLTFVNILFIGFNYTSQSTSDLKDLLSSSQIQNWTNDTNQLINLTISASKFKSTSISSTLSIISVSSYIFFAIIILLGVYLIIISILESKNYKQIEKLGIETIELESIITLLYSIKIKYPSLIQEKKDNFFLFDKIDFRDYKNLLIEILNENEKHIKRT